MNTAEIREILPLSENLDVLLSALRDGQPASWATPQLLRRASGLGLVDTTGTAPTLTDLGATVATITGEHRLDTWRKPLGRGRIAGSGMQYGLKASCSCRQWTWNTNEKPSRAKGPARGKHADHLAALITAAQAQ